MPSARVDDSTPHAAATHAILMQITLDISFSLLFRKLVFVIPETPFIRMTLASVIRLEKKDEKCTNLAGVTIAGVAVEAGSSRAAPGGV